MEVVAEFAVFGCELQYSYKTTQYSSISGVLMHYVIIGGQIYQQVDKAQQGCESPDLNDSL